MRRSTSAPPFGKLGRVLLGGEDGDDATLVAGRRHVSEVVIAEELLDLRLCLESGDETDTHGVAGHCPFSSLECAVKTKRLPLVGSRPVFC